MPLTIQEQLEIRALRGSFAVAANRRNFDQFAAIFAGDGIWHIPDMHAEFRGRAVVRGGIEHMLGLWEVFVQTTHDGVVEGDAIHATGRAYISEIGRFRAGGSQLNDAVYQDVLYLPKA